MSQKIENLLNLALEATPEERNRSEELNIGYDKMENDWELIIKYSGSLQKVREISRSVTELLNGYAIVVIDESEIKKLTGFPEVEFIEKPKRLYFQLETGRRVSCIDQVWNPPLSLSGKGVLIGIVDSGIDYSHPDFRNDDGTTRIISLWDQNIAGNPPSGYAQGTEYTRSDINRALNEPDIRKRFEIVPQRDISGHGTAVAGIAAGNGRFETGGRYRGTAPESELVVVRMGNARSDGFPRTTELMTGVDYIIRKALKLRMPAAVNISFGNTYGSHDGTSLLERFLSDAGNVWKNVICIGTGNEGNSAGHAAGRVDSETKEMELAVQNRETGFGLQIWKSYTDEIEISVSDPGGRTTGAFRKEEGAQRFVLGETELLVYYGEPKPYSVRQEIYIDFIPKYDFVDSGVWKIVLTPENVVEGNYEMWLPAQNTLNEGTAFLKPDSSLTLTIPSASERAVTVAAYDPLTFSYADFSGRGSGEENVWSQNAKPDLAAPGVRIMAPVPGGGYSQFSGTSFAVPFVTGAAALLMEWGIVRGNDPFLYGEKVKAYLRKGARKLPGYEKWPNPKLGYGALCVSESIPKQGGDRM